MIPAHGYLPFIFEDYRRLLLAVPDEIMMGFVPGCCSVIWYHQTNSSIR